MAYNHTQVGHLMIFALIAVMILFGYVLVVTDFMPFVLVILIVIIILLTSFSTLNVRIDKGYLRLKFGYGLFSKSLLLDDITSAKAVRNRWYYGWGLRYWSNVWIYNVSGFDAVEIKTKKGKTYRIGTDEPKKLERAISQYISK